jgi:5-formyltetrahydrofolate cyclo-ligase
MPEADQTKQSLREQVWSLLEREQAAPPGVRGHIPAFFGADRAAERLATLSVWQAARVVKAVPDNAQQPVRAHALREGKLVYMAVPKLADELPFYLLEPARLASPPEDAAATRRLNCLWQCGREPKWCAPRQRCWLFGH